MGNYKIISFDMEGTLITHSFSNHIWEEAIPELYAEENDMPIDVARSHVLAEYDEVGEESPLWYDVDYWFTRLGIPGEWRDLLPVAAKRLEVYPEVHNILERLSCQYSLIIASNTIREFLDVQLTYLKTEFKHVFSAPSDYGIIKKDPEFYSTLLSELGIDPTGVAHVGDHFRFDYEVPRMVGMDSYHLDREGKNNGKNTVEDLEEFESLIQA